MSAQQTRREYILGLGEMLFAHNNAFRKTHPDFESVDLVAVADITINGDRVLGNYVHIESMKDRMNRDLGDTQRALELCKIFVGAHSK